MLDFTAFLIVAEGLCIAALVCDRTDFPLTVIVIANGVAVGGITSIKAKGEIKLKRTFRNVKAAINALAI